MDQTPCTIFRACFAQKLGLDAVCFGTWPQMDRGHFDTHLLILVICRGGAPPSCLRKTVRSLKSPTGAFIAAQTRTTLFLLCTKSCIVWRKIGVWRSFRWKFIKRKSLKLLGTSRSFRLCYLKIGNLLLNRLHRGDTFRNRLTMLRDASQSRFYLHSRYL